MMETRSFIEVVAAVVVSDERALLCQRTDGPHLPLMWECPGGKIDPGESPPEALRRAPREEIGVAATIGTLLADVRHHYPKKSVRIRFYEVSIEGVPRPIVHRAVAWIPLRELPAYEVPPANQGVVDMLVDSLGEPALH